MSLNYVEYSNMLPPSVVFGTGDASPLVARSGGGGQQGGKPKKAAKKTAAKKPAKKKK